MLASAGFRQLALLDYMARLADATPAVAATLPAGLRLLPYAPDRRAIFVDALARSAEQSLDCPAMHALRTADEAFDGHANAGVPWPGQWRVLVDETTHQGVGLLVVSGMPGDAGSEITYLGLAPELRGRGVGQTVLQHALNTAARVAPGKPVALGVDALNGPAIRLYKKAGFRRVDQRRVLMKQNAADTATPDNDFGPDLLQRPITR